MGVSGRYPIVIAIALVVFITACGGSGSETTTTAGGGTGSANSITIDDFAYAPSELTVSVGSTVSWTNEQSASHTVTADDGEFDSGTLAQGDEFSETFGTAGTFAYHCTIHPSMTATITVEG